MRLPVLLLAALLAGLPLVPAAGAGHAGCAGTPTFVSASPTGVTTETRPTLRATFAEACGVLGAGLVPLASLTVDGVPAAFSWTCWETCFFTGRPTQALAPGTHVVVLAFVGAHTPSLPDGPVHAFAHATWTFEVAAPPS